MNWFSRFFLLVSLAWSAAGPMEESSPTTSTSNFIKILQDDRSFKEDGSYSYSFKTENGISRSETGSVGSSGAIVTKGEISYMMPNGEMYHMTYIADENGFQPQSKLLPALPGFVVAQIDKAKAEDEQREKTESMIGKSFQLEDIEVSAIQQEEPIMEDNDTPSSTPVEEETMTKKTEVKETVNEVPPEEEKEEKVQEETDGEMKEEEKMMKTEVEMVKEEEEGARKKRTFNYKRWFYFL